MNRLGIVFFVVMLLYSSATAQTTEFTYQGSLKNTGTAANGNFDFEFALFEALAGGSQVGGTVAVNNVAVTNGIFSVKLDFGNQFTGADRFLEIRVRNAGDPGFTILGPRQLMNSAPYSVKSINADNATNAATATNASQLGGVAAGQFVLTNDPRLSDSRNPLPNSANYVQNSITQQAAASFNVAGDGIVGGNVGIGTNTPRAKLDVAGNAVQNLSSNGLVKAMALVAVTVGPMGNTIVNIVRCYNSVLNTSTGNCGFTPAFVSNASTSAYRVVNLDFGFTINDRFLSFNDLNNTIDVPARNVGAIFFTNSTTVRVSTVSGTFFVFVY